MKKIVYMLIMFFMLSTIAVSIQAKVVKPIGVSDDQIELRVRQIKDRVEEIRAMDKSNLTGEQRKELRSELRAMKKEANALTGGGVYLSVGAILIIILVLIVLL